MNSPLQQFAEQLALWTELIIENGRTPFRRVDLFPAIHTDQGPLHPPLVFWINRQSMMAGGILLLPENKLEQELEQGRSCCQALGLKHFVTWESDQVRIWQLTGETIEQHQHFSLATSDHPDDFRHLLNEVLDALKLLAVIGHVDNDQLTPHYFHNLFQTTLDHALPALIDSYRRQRAEADDNNAEDADLLASEANRLLLLQLLTLDWKQLLPSAILPEKLERAIQLSLPLLNQPLQDVLTLPPTTNPPELPLETAVCFHHLLLRLRQLAWLQQKDRANTSLQLLIDGWQQNGMLESSAEILIYPPGPVLPPQTRLALSDSPALLAAASLRAELQQRQPVKLQTGNLFQLDLGEQKKRSLQAVLRSQQIPPRSERQQYATLLRTSWPNRRFRISADKPLWFWELIHLLGLAREQRHLTLVLPREILKSLTEEAFWEILSIGYRIEKITILPKQEIRLELLPEIDPDAKIEVQLATETRSCNGSLNLSRLRSRLLLALELPRNIFLLLDDKLLWPEQEALTQTEQKGLEIFLTTELCRILTGILGLNPQLSTAPDAPLEDLPRPDQLVLRELARTVDNPEATEQNADQMLSELLLIPQLCSLDSTTAKPQRKQSGFKPSNKKLHDELTLQLQKIGIPNFPEQYLYFLEEPEMVSYQLAPPLTRISEMLGEIELEDATGQRLKVYGEELASALLLCAQLGKTEIDLPKDRNQLALLQQQYWKGLKQLRKQLNSLCHSHLQNPKDADKLAKKVWKTLNLPKIS